jgi:hypothetical protein
VTGNVDATATLARIFGFDRIPVAAAGMAQKKKVEIMMILDRSGSMNDPAGSWGSTSKMQALQTASASFVDYFKNTQVDDKMGLISFATTAGINGVPDLALGNNFVTSMKTSIGNMNATGATNTEDAIDQTDGPGGFSDQTGVPGSNRIQQFVVFFSDGMPTALRDKFKFHDNSYNGNQDYDGVVYGVGSPGHANCRTSDYSSMSVYNRLHKPTGTNNFYTYSGGNYVDPSTTGDGKGATSLCKSGRPPAAYANTKWYLFPNYPVPGYGPEQCSIPMNVLLPYFCRTAKQLALDNAQVLKNKYIKIYAVGPQGQVDQDFLEDLSSGAGYWFIYDGTPGDLQAVFQKIAKDIKLRLVQ